MTALVIFCIESFFPGTFVPLLPGARPGKGYTDLNYIIHASLFSVKYGRRFFGFPRARGLQKGGGLCYTGEEENGDKTGGTTDMISERDVFSMMEGFGVPRTAKVTIRASIKSIGGIEGGADGLIDALKNYLSDGLLLVPTHTWATVTPANPVYDVRRTPPCIGTLADAAAFRRDGFRSLHPTHSMTGFGREAESYLAGEENAKTPTPVGGALSRLVEEDGYVLLIGVGMEQNTFLCAVDEMAEVPFPGHLSRDPFDIQIYDYAGRRTLDRGYRAHDNAGGSRGFPKFNRAFRETGATTPGALGEATVILGSCPLMADVMGRVLARADRDPLLSNEEITEDLYLD